MSRSEYDEVVARASGRVVAIASDVSTGWTQVYENGEHVRLDSQQAAALAIAGLIWYSPWDGPNARVYRLCDGYTLDDVRSAISWT